MRDMIGAMVVLLVIIGVVLAFYGSCSFSPGGPSVDQNAVPSADAAGQLTRTARTVEFPVREPALPEGWRANSASTTAVGAGAEGDVVVRVGWVTASGAYLQLSQSGGTVADVLVKETGQKKAPKPTGEVEVSGVAFTTYPARRDEVAWVAEVDGAVVLITGSAPESEYRQLATAVLKATPLNPPTS